MPVHLKGGVSDAVLYRATMGLTLMGMLLNVLKHDCPVSHTRLESSPRLKYMFELS